MGNHQGIKKKRAVFKIDSPKVKQKLCLFQLFFLLEYP